MTSTRFLTAVSLVSTVSLAGLLADLTAFTHAQAAVLSGTVSSAEEGLMEGVLVSAKKEGATITTTDEIVEYLLPRNTNIRRVFVVDKGPRPVLWAGNNHGNAIVKIEPLD